MDLPEWLPLTALGVLMLAAGLVSGVTGVRAGRWVTGPSSTQGAMYGITWTIAFIGMGAVIGRVDAFVPESWRILLWAGAMVGLTGVLHLAGGAIYHDKVAVRAGRVHQRGQRDRRADRPGAGTR
ncbi:MAG TPA: hypothetical protein VFH03_20250 [Actinoplanes sp.]|nr:hypothetical protein [Actinoplanes sp.]